MRFLLTVPLLTDQFDSIIDYLAEVIVRRAVTNVSEAVTRARFVGTDAASDEVVLLRILQVSTLLFY